MQLMGEILHNNVLPFSSFGAYVYKIMQNVVHQQYSLLQALGVFWMVCGRRLQPPKGEGAYVGFHMCLGNGCVREP